MNLLLQKIYFEGKYVDEVGKKMQLLEFHGLQ